MNSTDELYWKTIVATFLLYRQSFLLQLSTMLWRTLSLILNIYYILLQLILFQNQVDIWSSTVSVSHHTLLYCHLNKYDSFRINPYICFLIHKRYQLMKHEKQVTALEKMTAIRGQYAQVLTEISPTLAPYFCDKISTGRPLIEKKSFLMNVIEASLDIVSLTT